MIDTGQATSGLWGNPASPNLIDKSTDQSESERKGKARQKGLKRLLALGPFNDHGISAGFMPVQMCTKTENTILVECCGILCPWHRLTDLRSDTLVTDHFYLCRACLGEPQGHSCVGEPS